MRWSQQQHDFLVANYPKLGAKVCAEKLHLGLVCVKNKVRISGLRLNQEARNRLRLKDSTKCKVNPDQFISPETPQASYILGFLWADGFLASNNSIGTEITTDDAEYLLPAFLKTGKWSTFSRHRNGYKPQTKIVCSSKLFFEHLSSQGFKGRSHFPRDLSTSFPDHLLSYWLRGYSDGDGCFYFNAKQSCRQITFTSSVEQDWTELEKIMDKVGVERFAIRRTDSKTRYSQFRITNKNDVVRLGSFIYQGDSFGIKRKRAVFEAMSV
jgi:hypothetical protein